MPEMIDHEYVAKSDRHTLILRPDQPTSSLYAPIIERIGPEFHYLVCVWTVYLRLYLRMTCLH